MLLVPSLAAAAAGPASILAWAGLLLASRRRSRSTFAALGVRHPVAGGVSAYVREGFGADAAAVTGGWFLAAVLLGAPAVSLIGGYYVADLTGSGTAVAAAVGLAMFGVVLRRERARPPRLVGLPARALVGPVGVIVVARRGRAALARRRQLDAVRAARLVGGGHGGEHPRLALRRLGGGRPARRRLPPTPSTSCRARWRSRSASSPSVYVGLAVATIAVTAEPGSRVPLADLIAVGFGRAGRDATAVLAVALTMGTMNVYMGGAAKLAAALAAERRAPGLARRRRSAQHPAAAARPDRRSPASRSSPRSSRASAAPTTSSARPRACFVAVYLLALGSAIRILDGGARAAAAVALVAHRRRRRLLVDLPARAGGGGARRARVAPQLDQRGRSRHDRAMSVGSTELKAKVPALPAPEQQAL